MYLLEEHLRRILWKCYHYNKNISIDFANKTPDINIDNIKIYVSSGGKNIGWIWDQIIEKPKILYHVGDNYHSDYIKATENGFNAIHYKGTPYSEYEIILKDNSNLDLANFSRHIRLMNIYEPDSQEHLLFNLSANINIPVLLLVCTFLKSLDKRILFFLRDCYYLKIFYDLLNQDKHDSKYLFCSRLCFLNGGQEYIDYFNKLIDNDTVLVDVQATGSSFYNFLKYNNIGIQPLLYVITSQFSKYDNLIPITKYNNFDIVECLNSNFLNSFVNLENNIFQKLELEHNLNYINIIQNTIYISIKFLINNILSDKLNIQYNNNIIDIIYNNNDYNVFLYSLIPQEQHKITTNLLKYDTRLNFIIFHTEGQSIDNGKDLSKLGKLLENIYTPFFDSFKRYTVKKCFEIDPEFINTFMKVYPEYDHGEHSRGNKHGFWRWKAFIIKYHLSLLTDGEVLIYQDSNCQRYPYFLEYVHEYRNNVVDIFQNIASDVIIPLERPVDLFCKYHVKNQIFETVGENTDYYRNFPLLNANRIFIKKSDLSVKFIQEWFDYCMGELILPEKREEPELRWSTHDQAIISVLYRKYMKQKLFQNRGVFIKDKIFSKENIQYINDL
jgi:hypothetical protein